MFSFLFVLVFVCSFQEHLHVACYLCLMTWCGLAPSWLSPFTCPCSARLVLCSHFVNLAIKMPVPGVLLGFVSAAGKDGRPYTNIPTTHLQYSQNTPKHPLASFQNGLGCTLLQHHHFTRAAHLPHPLPKRVRLWGVHWHRTDWRLLGCTPRIHLQTV